MEEIEEESDTNLSQVVDKDDKVCDIIHGNYVLKKHNMNYLITFLLTQFDKSKYKDGWYTDDSSSFSEDEDYDSDKAEQEAIKEHQPIKLRLLVAEE